MYEPNFLPQETVKMEGSGKVTRIALWVIFALAISVGFIGYPAADAMYRAGRLSSLSPSFGADVSERKFFKI